MLLPPAWYPDAAAGPLLDAVADQVHEYDRHGYAVALIGERAGLDAALARAGLTVPASVRPRHRLRAPGQPGGGRVGTRAERRRGRAARSQRGSRVACGSTASSSLPNLPG